MTKRQLDDYLENIPRDAVVYIKVSESLALNTNHELSKAMLWLKPGSVYDRKQRQKAAKKAAATRRRNRKKGER